MRIVRVVAIVVGALVALAVVGLIGLLLFVDPNRYRGDIQRVAREQTAREVTLGKLSLKVFPWLALSVRDVQVGNAPGFGSQPFMTVRNASIGVKLLPLLGKRIEVSKIALDGVSVNLVSRGEQNNWKDLGKARDQQQTPANEGPSGAALSIEGVDLSKSSLSYQDEVKKTRTELSDLELHTGRLEIGGQRASIANVDFQGAWLARSPDRKPGEEPKPLPFSLRTAGFTVDSAAHSLAPSKIELKVGDTALVISVSGEKMSSADQLVKGDVSLPATSPRKLLQSLGIAAPVTRDARALSKLALQTNFGLTDKSLRLSALKLTLDDTQVLGSAAVENLETNALSFDLNVDSINLDRYRPPVDKAQEAKRAQNPPPAKPPTPLPLETLRKLDVHGSLKVGTATLAGLTFSKVVMPLVAKDGHVRLGPTEARLYGGAYNGDIVLDARPVQAQLSLNEHLHGTDIGALMKAAYDSSRLSGRADANVAVASVGNTDEALIRSLAGKLDANVKQGALNGIDIVYEMQRANSLLKRQMPPQRSGPARTAFNTLQMNGTIDKGILKIDDLRMETDFLKVRGGGTLDTATEAINYQLVTAVNKAGGADRGAAGGLDALGAIEVPLTITGTMSSPTVRPDIEALAKGRLGQEVQHKAQDLVKKKLGDKLKDLFGH